MADFSINSTQLSDPQGRGATPIAPTQEQAINTVPMNLISTIGEVFAKGLAQNAKEEAEKRKAAIIGEYTNAEKTYSEALTTGQWNAGQATAASRAKFMQLLAAHPEYTSELMQARSAVYGGTEISEAEKKRDAAFKLRESDKAGASAAGFTFFDGMSTESENKTLDAWKTSVRVQNELKQYREASAEDRAARADQRAEETHQMAVDQHVAKEKALSGILEIADKNFDAYMSKSQDLFAAVSTGKMTPEQATMQLDMDSKRITAGLLSVSRMDQNLAAPWTKLFGDMQETAKQLLDPSKKSATELQLLKDKFETLVTRQKLMAVESDKDLLKTVAGTALFPGQPLIGLSSVPAVKRWVLGSTGVDPNVKPQGQMVGTKNDSVVFKEGKDALNRLQTGKIPVEQKEQAVQEATSFINNLLHNTTTVDGQIQPQALKNASQFYASTEFGKFVLEHPLDAQTASNVQKVFQVKYQPVVQDAIVRRLNDAKVADKVEITVSGSQVKFIAKEVPTTDTKILGLVGSPATSENMRREDLRKSFSEAEAGLNQLIRMHAHLEGTTDYGKYWEAHKHELLPSVYPDPNKLKPGQVVNGYKYNGGNYRNRGNWEQVSAAN